MAMSVITKRGDKGQTDMLGVGRVDKNDDRLEIFGDLDELGAAVGAGFSAINRQLLIMGLLELHMVLIPVVCLHWLWPHPIVDVLLFGWALYRLHVYYSGLLRYRVYTRVCVEIMENLIKFGGDMSRVRRGLELHHAWQMYNELAENYVHRYEGELPALTSWILPTGDFGASELHLARAVARRAERSYYDWAQDTTNPDPQMAIYLNRLSDLLFTLARACSGGDFCYQP